MTFMIGVNSVSEGQSSTFQRIARKLQTFGVIFAHLSLLVPSFSEDMFWRRKRQLAGRNN